MIWKKKMEQTSQNWYLKVCNSLKSSIKIGNVIFLCIFLRFSAKYDYERSMVWNIWVDLFQPVSNISYNEYIDTLKEIIAHIFFLSRENLEKFVIGKHVIIRKYHILSLQNIWINDSKVIL